MSQLRRLWLTDFRGYHSLDIEFDPGLTAVVGNNGQGKTNLVEAVGWLSTLSSFRGAANDTLVRQGAEAAVIRAEIDADGRSVLIEAEIPRSGRTRVQLNRQRLVKASELLNVIRCTIFSPDDLVLIKAGPRRRRSFIDETFVGRHPRNDDIRLTVDKILRQRNTLLKQAHGRLTDDVAVTLDVWDTKLAAAGNALADGRAETVALLAPRLAEAYDQLAGASSEVEIVYHAPWRTEGLAPALAASRTDDVRRGVTTVGPQRDDLLFGIAGMPARTHASQGEQRSLVLALRLASHRLTIDETGRVPILLLDDVFSELDPDRSDALLRQLPDGQVLLTSAAGLPSGADPALLRRIDDHVLVELSS